MAEKRLIDANALLELYDMGAELEDYAGTLSVPVPVIRLNIRDMPTVDAVEVVRCKDCKWCVSSVCRHGFGLNWSREDDFCSYGERRTDG